MYVLKGVISYWTVTDGMGRCMNENVNERMIYCSVPRDRDGFHTGVVKDSRTERMSGVRTGRGRGGKEKNGRELEMRRVITKVAAQAEGRARLTLIAELIGGEFIRNKRRAEI